MKREGACFALFTAGMIVFDCPGAGGLCGLQSIVKPLREKPYASPASLDIKMNVFIYIKRI